MSDLISLRLQRPCAAGYIKVQVTIVVVVNKRDASAFSRNSSRIVDLLEGTVLFVMEQHYFSFGDDGEIGCSIVVIITSRTTGGMQFRVKSGGFCGILELAMTEVVV